MKTVDPRLRFPDIPMTEREAQTIMQYEAETGFPFRSRTAIDVALRIERATPMGRAMIYAAVDKAVAESNHKKGEIQCPEKSPTSGIIWSF